MNRKIQISILISEWVENGPLTLYESFAYNCPVIINDTPNVKEYVSTCEMPFEIEESATAWIENGGHAGNFVFIFM